MSQAFGRGKGVGSKKTRYTGGEDPSYRLLAIQSAKPLTSEGSNLSFTGRDTGLGKAAC